MKIRTHMIGISFLVVIFTTVLFVILLITSMRQMYLDSVMGEIRRAGCLHMRSFIRNSGRQVPGAA